MRARGSLHVLQDGFPKCGNLWLYNILTRMFDEAGVERSSYIRQHPVYPALREVDFDFGAADIDCIDITTAECYACVRDTFREVIDDLDAYVSSTSVVWSHSPWNEAMWPVVCRAFDKVVYLIRDPRDAVVSNAHFVFTPYKMRYAPHGYGSPQEWLEANYKAFVTDWSGHVRGHLINAKKLGVYPLFYERLKDDTPGEVAKLARHLGIDLTTDSIRAVVEATSVEATRRLAPLHVRQAQTGRWRETLSARQARWISDRHGALIGLLGYDGPGGLPAFDVNDELAIDAMEGMGKTSVPRRIARAVRAAVAASGGD